MKKNHFTDDYLIPTPNQKAVNQQLFVFNMAKRPFDLVMYSIKKLSNNYGGSNIIGLCISQPVSFLMNFSSEYFRHPDENNWQHIGRAVLRTGFEYAVSSLGVPFYRTLSFAAEVANHYWNKSGGMQELYKFENLAYDKQLVDDMTRHLAPSLSDQKKQDLALVFGHDLFEARKEALGMWGTFAKTHQVKGAIIDGIGDILLVCNRQPEPVLKIPSVLEYDTASTAMSESVETPPYDFSEFNPRRNFLTQLQADMEQNPLAVRAMAEQIFCPPQRTFSDFLAEHVRVNVSNDGFSIEIGTPGFFSKDHPMPTPSHDTPINLLTAAVTRWNDLHAAYAEFDNYMRPHFDRLQQLSADVQSLVTKINALDKLTSAFRDIRQEINRIEVELDSFAARYQKINKDISFDLEHKTGKPEIVQDFWGDGIDPKIKRWFEQDGHAVELPRLRAYGRQQYQAAMDATLWDGIRKIHAEFRANRIIFYHNHQAWNDVILTFKECYGAVDITQVDLRDRLLYAIAQQKIQGNDLPVVTAAINTICQDNRDGLTHDENLSLLKCYAVVALRDEDTALLNMDVIKFCFDASLQSEDSEFWLRSLSNLYLMQGQSAESVQLFRRWIDCHPDYENTDEIKFIFARIQHAIGEHSAAEATITSIRDQSSIDQAVLDLYRLAPTELIDATKKMNQVVGATQHKEDNFPHAKKARMPDNDEGIKRDLPPRAVNVCRQQRQVVGAVALQLETGKPRHIRRAQLSQEGGTQSQKHNMSSQTDEDSNVTFKRKLADRIARQSHARLAQENPSLARQKPTVASIHSKIEDHNTRHAIHLASVVDRISEAASAAVPEKNMPIESADVNARERALDIQSFTRDFNLLLDAPASTSNDFLRAFLDFDSEQALLGGYFEEVYTKFLVCLASNQLAPNDAKQYVAKLVQILESHLKVLAEGADIENSMKHMWIVDQALSAFSKDRALFTETSINHYAAQFNQHMQKANYDSIENIAALRLAAQKLFSHSAERLELQRASTRAWHERGMQAAEISQYLLDKFHAFFPQSFPESYYLALDSSIECWSRFHEVLSNEAGVLSFDSFLSVFAGVSILARNLAHYLYSNSQYHFENFHRYPGETLESADERLSQLLNERFERFQYLVMADISAVTAGVAVSREFFFGGGEKNWRSTGLLYLAHYLARVGMQCYRFYQESTLRSTGQYDVSITAAAFAGFAHGIAQNPFMQSRVLVGGLLSFLNRLNLMPHIIWGTSATLTGLATEKLIEKKIIQKATAVTTNNALSLVVAKLLMGANFATGVLLAHDVAQYGTLIYGDNKLMNLMKQIEEAEKFEKKAAAFVQSGAQKKADDLFEKAKYMYQKIERSFAALDYRLNYSEKLYLKQELGRLQAKLHHANLAQAWEVFDDALGILSKDEMFNREKPGIYRYMASDPHTVYQDEAAPHVLSYAKLAGQAFLKMVCTLKISYADKIADFERETGQIAVTKEVRTELNGIIDVMKLHSLQGQTQDFVRTRPAGLYIFDEDSKKLQENNGIHTDHKKLSDHLNSVKFHNDTNAEARRILQATADLHFGRFASPDHAHQSMSALSSVLSHMLFISVRFRDLYAYCLGRDPGFHQEHKEIYTFSQDNLIRAFSAKKARFDLFFADLFLRALMWFVTFCFKRRGFAEESLVPRTIYAILACFKEIVLNSIMNKIRLWSEVQPVAGWQDFIQKGSFLMRLALPLLSLLLPSMDSAIKNPSKGIFMAGLIGILLLLNGFSLGCFGFNLLSTESVFSMNPVESFLGILFTSHLLISQVLPILHYVFQLNLLACAFRYNNRDEAGCDVSRAMTVEQVKRAVERAEERAIAMKQAQTGYLAKIIQFFKNSVIFSCMNWLSTAYYFYTMHALNDVVATYQFSANIASWLLWIGTPGVFIMGECLAFFVANFDRNGAIGLAGTMVALYLIKAISDLFQDRIKLPAKRNLDHSTNWMSFINCLSSLNLWSFFNTIPPADQLTTSSMSAPASTAAGSQISVEGRFDRNSQSTATSQRSVYMDGTLEKSPLLFTMPARENVTNLHFNPQHQSQQFISTRLPGLVRNG